MRLSAFELQALRREPDEHAVSADAALAFVRTRRRDGGPGRLILSAFLLTFVLVMGVAAMLDPVWVTGLIAGILPLGVMLRRGLQSSSVTRAMAEVSSLAQPLSAAVVDRNLLLGTTGTPPERWVAIPMSAKQEGQIRALGLPGAYVRR